MNFFNQKIVTKTISLEDAVKKAAEPKPAVRSLDEIIANAKQMKTAIAKAETKTAAVEAPKPEAPKTAPKAEVKAEVKPSVTVKVAAEMSAPKVEAPKAEVKPVAPAKTAASDKHVVKIAKELDFRGWEAQAIVDNWKQHGNVEACVKNVGDKASDGVAYCKLLSVAASEADKVIKTAAAKKPTAPVYKKIAKLTSQEQSFLRDFFKKIYGEEYVTALLGDY